MRSTQKLPIDFDRSAREAAYQRDRKGDAGGRGNEVLDGQAGHLHEIGHRAFAAVVLPVGVGHEADGGVEGKFRRNCGHAGRIERQRCLEALQQVEHQNAEQVEGEHRADIGHPVLFLALVGAGHPVEQPLEGHEQEREECALAIEDARHVAAERLHEKNDDPAEDEDLNPAVEGHGLSAFAIMKMARQKRSGRSSA